MPSRGAGGNSDRFSMTGHIFDSCQQAGGVSCYHIALMQAGRRPTERLS